MASDLSAAMAKRHYPRFAPWLEFLLGLFNIHGVGYFFVDRPVTGVVLLIISAGLHAIGIGTLLVGCLFVLPVGWIMAIMLGLHLNGVVRRHNHRLHQPV